MFLGIAGENYTEVFFFLGAFPESSLEPSSSEMYSLLLKFPPAIVVGVDFLDGLLLSFLRFLVDDDSLPFPAAPSLNTFISSAYRSLSTLAFASHF